jgi:Flp pilus assembly protein TadG
MSEQLNTEIAQTGSFLNRLRNSAKVFQNFKKIEDGSMTVFTLFIFVLMLLIGGMAVDLIRFETQRAHLQNSLDSATLAATNLNSDADPTALVQNFMEKNGFDPNLVNVTPLEVRSGGDPANGIPGTLQSRSVQANYQLDVNTIFMHMMGIDALKTGTQGKAAEGTQAVEISMVLDISGSMSGQKLTDLKLAAKNFVNQVIDPARTVAVTSVSVVPYNHSVVVPQNLLSELNVNSVINIPTAAQAPYPGALTSFDRTSDRSSCVRFYDNEMTTSDLQDGPAFDLDPNANFRTLRRISAGSTSGQPLDRMQAFDFVTSDGFAGPPNSSNYRCDPSRASILPFETDIGTLETYFDSLTADGWTATDTGIKWGVALLDPAMRDATNAMVAGNDLPATVADRPLDYDASTSLKVMVVMTDGANTRQYDVAPQFKNGPSRVWFSAESASDLGPNNEDWSNINPIDNDGDGQPDRQKQNSDGYYVEMPNNPAATRFLRPQSPGSTTDGTLINAIDLPADAVQLSYTDLYDTLSGDAVASLFDDVNGDPVAAADHANAEQDVHDNGSANTRMNGNGTLNGMCDIAKVNNDILVYTIAFQAGSSAETVMRACASGQNGSGFYFPASNGTALNTAFSTIAGAITKLRLTQ